MASKELHWMEKAMIRARASVERSKASMKAQVIPDMIRRPNTSDLVIDMLSKPGGIQPEGRDRLAQYLRDSYGPAADVVLPYIGVEEDEYGDPLT